MRALSSKVIFCEFFEKSILEILKMDIKSMSIFEKYFREFFKNMKKKNSLSSKNIYLNFIFKEQIPNINILLRS